MTVPDRLWPTGPIDLPPEAGNIAASRFEPSESWLTHASPALQQAALWRWFASRFDEPRYAVPHHEGSDDFMWGDDEPVQADQAVKERFASLVPPPVIQEFLAALRAEVGNEWAIKRVDKAGG
jgi:hypothetical protein